MCGWKKRRVDGRKEDGWNVRQDERVDGRKEKRMDG